MKITWKRWLSFDFYKKLWCWAGKPYTFIRRDIWHDLEYVNIVGYVALGVLLALFQLWILVWLLESTWNLFIFIWVVWTLGFLDGHFFFNADERRK